VGVVDDEAVFEHTAADPDAAGLVGITAGAESRVGDDAVADSAAGHIDRGLRALVRLVGEIVVGDRAAVDERRGIGLLDGDGAAVLAEAVAVDKRINDAAAVYIENSSITVVGDQALGNAAVRDHAAVVVDTKSLVAVSTGAVADSDGGEDGPRGENPDDAPDIGTGDFDILPGAAVASVVEAMFFVNPKTPPAPPPAS